MKSTFTAQEIAQIKKLLAEEAANEPPEGIQMEAPISSLRDKIAALHGDGISDEQIATMITQVVGATVTGEQIAQLFVVKASGL